MSYILRAVVVSVVAASVLVSSAIDARAGLIDYIWDTSGPQFLGKVFRCRAAISGGSSEQKCDPLFGRPVTAPAAPVWLSVESGIYTSLWKDSEAEDGTNVPFGAFQTVMFAFDPIVEFRSLRRGNWALYHGIGLSAMVMASADFPRTGNLGYKLRVAGIEWDNGSSVAFNLRLFPDGFGADEFGVGPRPLGDRPFETSIGVLFGLPLRF